MNREIEFRGRDIKTGNWVYGSYFKHQKRTCCPINDNISEEDFEHLIISDGFSDWNMSRPIEYNQVIKESVGQYTGLKDAEGKKIYEGDVVQLIITEELLNSTFSNSNLGKQVIKQGATEVILCFNMSRSLQVETVLHFKINNKLSYCTKNWGTLFPRYVIENGAKVIKDKVVH